MKGEVEVYQCDYLKGSKLAYKKGNKLTVSPSIASLIKDADEPTLELLLKNISVVDLDIDTVSNIDKIKAV